MRTPPTFTATDAELVAHAAANLLALHTRTGVSFGVRIRADGHLVVECRVEREGELGYWRVWPESPAQITASTLAEAEEEAWRNSIA